MRNIICVISLLFFFLGATAQTGYLVPSNPTSKYKKNYFLTHLDYTFMGTGDIKGKSLGATYTRMVYKNIGVSASYRQTKAYGRAYNEVKGTNVSYELSAEVGESIKIHKAMYDSYNLGLTYRVNDGLKHKLLLSAGFNVKHMDYQYVSRSQNKVVSGIRFWNEWSPNGYASLDYLYFFRKDIALGVHASLEGGNIIIGTGVSLGTRF